MYIKKYSNIYISVINIIAKAKICIYITDKLAQELFW